MTFKNDTGAPAPEPGNPLPKLFPAELPLGQIVERDIGAPAPEPDAPLPRLFRVELALGQIVENMERHHAELVSLLRATGAPPDSLAAAETRHRATVAYLQVISGRVRSIRHYLSKVLP